MSSRERTRFFIHRQERDPGLIWFSLGLLVSGGLLVWALPTLISAYYLEKGGWALRQAHTVGTEPDAGQQALASEYLLAALRWQDENAQAYRLLARLDMLEQDLVRAASDQAHLVALRPDHPLACWELAQIYEQMDKSLQAAHPLDVTLFLPGANGAEPTRCPARSTGPAGASLLCDQVEARWVLPLGSGAKGTEWPPEPIQVERQVRALPSTAQVRLEMTVPNTATVLFFWLGLDPTTVGGAGRDADLGASVGGVQFSYPLYAHGRQEWWPVSIDLEPWAGQQISLTLQANLSPGGAVVAPLVGWGDFQLLTTKSAQYANLAPRERALSAWKAGGFSALDLVVAGRDAAKKAQYSNALRWYEQASRLDPGLGDPWYFMGLALQDQELWDQALSAHKQALDLGSFARIGRSSPLYQMGNIYLFHSDPPQTGKALDAYEAAIHHKAFVNAAEEADSHFRRGQILWQTGADASEYIDDYQTAIAIDPKHVSAHIMLGVTYYFRLQNIQQAEAELARAIELDPEAKWAFYYWGEIYRYEQDLTRAREFYDKALAIDPGFDLAKQRQQNLND